MDNQKFGLREIYQDWKNLSSTRRKELKGKALRSFGKNLVDEVKSTAIIALGTAALMLGIEGLAYCASNIEPMPNWSSKVYRDGDSTILERNYNPTGGLTRYIDSNSDGLDLSDDVYQIVPRAGIIGRKATQSDIEIFKQNNNQ